MNRFALQRLPVLVLNSDAAPSRLQAIDPAIQDFWFTRGFRDYLVVSLPFVIRWLMKIDQSPTITPIIGCFAANWRSCQIADSMARNIIRL